MTSQPLVARLAPAIAVAACATVMAGCGAIKSSAIKTVADTLAAEGTTFTADNDPELVSGALPFALKLYESLLASVPRHEPLLTSTCSAFTQYAYGFVQGDAEVLQFDDFEKSRVLNERALRLALRARDFCWRGLEERFRGAGARLKANPATAIPRAERRHVPLLYWSAASLGTAVSLGGLDHPELLIHWPVVRALAERALALDEAWSRGALHELMITVESQGEVLGGSEERARKHFARAVEIQKGQSPAPYVALAMGISKAKQDRDEFEKLLKQALAIDPEQDPDYRLVALLTQRRARFLLDHIDDLILK